MAISIARVCERIGIERPLETYILNEPSCSAHVPCANGEILPVVVLSSGLVQLLDPAELDFVIGHEIGHYGFGRDDSVVAAHSANMLHELAEAARRRAAEISADRIGLIACGSVFVAARVMLKLASGLPTALLGTDIDAFVRQTERSSEEVSRRWELSSTHPSPPLRLWALLQFAQSDVFSNISGQSGEGQHLDAVNTRVVEKLEAMGDGYLTELEGRASETALIWASACMVLAIKKRGKSVVGELTMLIGAKNARRALDFAKANGITEVYGKLTSSIHALNSATSTSRASFVNKLLVFTQRLGTRPEVEAVRVRINGMLAAH